MLASFFGSSSSCSSPLVQLGPDGEFADRWYAKGHDLVHHAGSDADTGVAILSPVQVARENLLAALKEFQFLAPKLAPSMAPGLARMLAAQLEDAVTPAPTARVVAWDEQPAAPRLRLVNAPLAVSAAEEQSDSANPVAPSTVSSPSPLSTEASHAQAADPETETHRDLHPPVPVVARIFADDAGTGRCAGGLEGDHPRAHRVAGRKGRHPAQPLQGSLFGTCA